MIVKIPIQLRNGTAADFTAANPTLLKGELGAEWDTGKVKIGNGSDDWNTLGYLSAVAANEVLTGATDPNGAVSGIAGQIYTQIPGDGTAQLWTNVDGAMQWV